MPGEDIGEAARMAAIAGGMGGAARVLVALQGGGRGLALVLDFANGVVLGLMAAGVAVWWDPDLRDMGWPVLIVAAVAGCAGAIGTRVLDIVTEVARKRLGG